MKPAGYLWARHIVLALGRRRQGQIISKNPYQKYCKYRWLPWVKADLEDIKNKTKHPHNKKHGVGLGLLNLKHYFEAFQLRIFSPILIRGFLPDFNWNTNLLKADLLPHLKSMVRKVVACRQKCYLKSFETFPLDVAWVRDVKSSPSLLPPSLFLFPPILKKNSSLTDFLHDNPCLCICGNISRFIRWEQDHCRCWD